MAPIINRLLLLTLAVTLTLAWPGGRKPARFAKTDDREITPEELNILESELPPEIPVKPAKPIPDPNGDEDLFAKKGKKDPNDVILQPSDSIMAQMEKEMVDFLPEKMLSLDLLAKTDEVFLQDL